MVMPSPVRKVSAKSGVIVSAALRRSSGTTRSLPRLHAVIFGGNSVGDAGLSAAPQLDPQDRSRLRIEIEACISGELVVRDSIRARHQALRQPPAVAGRVYDATLSIVIGHIRDRPERAAAGGDRTGHGCVGVLDVEVVRTA
jgi:hypothetical protein